MKLIIRVFSTLCFVITATLAVSLSKHGCPEMCGNVTIPYPFGIGLKCSANSGFVVICPNSTNPPRPFLSSINREVVYIDLYGVVIVNQRVSPMNCSNGVRRESLPISLKGTPFTISAHYNSLVVMGCKNLVWLRTNETAAEECMAVCDASSPDTSCNGVNCCQTTIPTRLQELQFNYKSIQASNSSFCGYVFSTDKKWLQNDEVHKRYKGLVRDLTNPFDPEFGFAPLVLEWELGNTAEVVHVICNDNGSYSVDDYDGCVSSSRFCYCIDGYEGNPYMVKGCSDVDECRDATLNICHGNETCINIDGAYSCYQPAAGGRVNVDYYGYKDTKVNFKGIITKASIVIGAMIFSFVVWKASKDTRAIKAAIQAKRKYKFFKRNGGLLLQQQLSGIEDGIEKTKLFTSSELEKATDNYHENHILGRGGEGVVYKGMLEDGRVVAVKKAVKVNQGDVGAFANEIVIVSQINHRNIVKLLGCCLESEVPHLVYEFVPNGTLFHHLHDVNGDFSLSWEIRVRIAKQVAGGLAYLHSAASSPIYHRDIKSTNILLDAEYQAKISDFGASRSVSLDQTHVTTRVVGTFGYLDPEYFQLNQFTEKSDVYSFGVVLVELITGEKAISAARIEEGMGLAMHFLHSMEENRLFEILDARVLKEAKEEEIEAMAEIARKCLHLKGKSRPTMKEVARELEEVQDEKEEAKLLQNQIGSRVWNSSEDADHSVDFSYTSDIVELPLCDESLNNISGTS